MSYSDYLFRAIHKVERSILSCVSYEQLNSANKMVNNLFNLINFHADDDRVLFIHACLSELISIRYAQIAQENYNNINKPKKRKK